MGQTTQLCSMASTLHMGTAISPDMADKGAKARTFRFFLIVPGYAMLMRPNKAKTAVHGCHCSGDMAVHMRKVLDISCVVLPMQFKLGK